MNSQGFYEFLKKINITFDSGSMLSLFVICVYYVTAKVIDVLLDIMYKCMCKL